MIYKIISPIRSQKKAIAATYSIRSSPCADTQAAINVVMGPSIVASIKRYMYICCLNASSIII